MKRAIGALLISILLLAGCGDPDDPTRPNDFVALSAITIQSANPVIAEGTGNQFRAIGNFSDTFARDITGEVDWQVAAGGENVLEFTTTAGLANGIAAGFADITASLDGIVGTLQDFEVSDAPIQQLTVTPASAKIAEGGRRQFTAQGLFGIAPDSFTQDVTREVTWSVAPPELASFDATGTATGLAAGEGEVAATFTNPYGTASASTSLTVLGVDRVEITPASAVLVPGDTLQFTAKAFLTDGTEDTTATFTWSSSQEGVATVNSNGLATAIAGGHGGISAETGGTTGTASISVATLQSIGITPATSTLGVNQTLQLTATGGYSGILSRDITNQVEWTADPTTVATVSAGGLVTGRAPGSVTITATEGTISQTKTITVQ